MKNNKNDIQYLPMFMCFGISFGMVFGMLTGNQTLGMSIGMSVGVCVGTLLDAQKKKKTTLKAVAFEIVSEHTELYADTKNVLRALKEKGYKTAIVTTKHDNQIQQILSKFQMNDLIDMIVGSNNVKNPKPDPEGLLSVLWQMNLKREEVIYVGDSFVDAKAAENAGVKFVAVLTGTTTKEEFEKYKNVYIAKNLEDVYRYILDTEQ